VANPKSSKTGKKKFGSSDIPEAKFNISHQGTVQNLQYV